MVAVSVLISVLALIGSGDAASAGVLEVPVGRIAVVVVVGYLVALVLLVAALVSRSVPSAWVAAVLSVGVALVVSVYPLFATAGVAVDQAREVLPWILDLIRRVNG